MITQHEYTEGEFVRLLWVEDENDPNAYATVIYIHEDGDLWVSNLNTPWLGTISTKVNPTMVAPQ